MREKAAKRRRHICAGGITPAYAGKRVRCSQQALPRTDHPRMCGEKSSTTKPASSRKGSPPRMRGKAQIRLLSIWQRGITPAYAGKRKTAWKGEGKKRITPACAGKSRLFFCSRLNPEDHPRMCGEKRGIRLPGSLGRGSPPHVRGKVDGCAQLWPFDRITPACAGKRLKRFRSTVPPVAIVPLFPSVCNKPVVSDGSPAGRDAPLFLPAENAVPASPAYNLRSL